MVRASTPRAIWTAGSGALAPTRCPTPRAYRSSCRSSGPTDGDKTLTFLTEAFGFERGLEVRDAQGRLVHAELWLGTSPLMIGGDHAEWRGRSQCTHVHVTDPDAHASRARAAGADILAPIADTPYGARGYLAQDPEQFLWSFSTYRPEPNTRRMAEGMSQKA